MTYRVQVQVGVDVDATTDGEAMTKAINKVREAIGEDPEAPHPKELWVTGICRDFDGDYMAWEQED